MSLNVTIPPKLAAVDAATTAQTRSSPTDALVLHIYCDGSYKRGSYTKRIRPRGGIGIVANFWLPRDTTKQRTSKACFIPCNRDDTSTSTEAFALAEGAYLALDRIKGIQAQSPIRSTDAIEVIFWSDSVTVLEALEDPVRLRAQAKKLRHVLDIIKLKTYEMQGLRANMSVQFRWCPEECVEPHVTADDLSRQVRLSGGNTTSKALDLFKHCSNSSIQSAIGDYVNDDSLSPEQVGSSSSGNSDPYAFIEIAALELPVQHKDVILAAIELQKKVNLARAHDGTQGQASEPEGQVAESDDHLAKSEGLEEPSIQGGESDDRYDSIEGQLGQVSGYDGQVDENDDQPRELEDQVYESDGHSNGDDRIGEPESGEDGDVNEDVEIIGQARPSRMHNMWNWVERKLPRL